MKKLPDMKYLMECFYLHNGELYWKLRPPEHFPTARGWATFNGKNAGKKVGSVGTTGHAVLTLDRKKLMVSRVIFKLFFGIEAQDLYIVHRDGDRLNNHPSNLVLETKDVCISCRKKSKRTRGVSWSQSAQKWIAKIGDPRKPKWTQAFEDIEEACAVVSSMRKKIYGDYNGVQ